jgi:hypothetical protein
MHDSSGAHIMTAPPRFSLAQQIEAVRFAETRQRTLATGGSVKGLRGTTVEGYDLQRLNAAARTLEWLRDHEADIRALLALSPAARATALAWGAEIMRREAAAEAGGPVP